MLHAVTEQRTCHANTDEKESSANHDQPKLQHVSGSLSAAADFPRQPSCRRARRLRDSCSLSRHDRSVVYECAKAIRMSQVKCCLAKATGNNQGNTLITTLLVTKGRLDCCLLRLHEYQGYYQARPCCNLDALMHDGVALQQYFKINTNMYRSELGCLKTQ